MIKPLAEKQGKIEIDLTGPEGNAYVLLAKARQLAKQMALDVDDIEKEMTAGNYENLIEVFDKYFGEYVTLYR